MYCQYELELAGRDGGIKNGEWESGKVDRKCSERHQILGRMSFVRGQKLGMGLANGWVRSAGAMRCVGMVMVVNRP